MQKPFVAHDYSYVDYMSLRDEEMAQIESSLRDVNEITRDLSICVVHQGYSLDNIEANMSVVNDNVEQGSKSLQKANRYATSNRKRWCILLILLAVILAILVIVILKTR